MIKSIGLLVSIKCRTVKGEPYPPEACVVVAGTAVLVKGNLGEGCSAEDIAQLQIQFFLPICRFYDQSKDGKLVFSFIKGLFDMLTDKTLKERFW